MLEKLFERWFLLPFAPGAELLFGLALFGVVALVLRKRARQDAGAIPTAIRIASGLVIAVWAIDVITKVLWVRFPVIPWWSLVLPLLVASGGAAVVALHRRPAARAGVPALAGVRRMWWSFTSRSALVTAGVLIAVLAIVTVAAGAVSIPDENGQLIFVSLAGNGVSSFYGWTLGVPVLVGVLLLCIATFAALSKISAPPFASPSTIQSESRQRRVSSGSVLFLAFAVVALTLGGALQIIGFAGAGIANDVAPSTGFSSFATFFRWTGWALQVTSFAALAALALRWSPVRSATSEKRFLTASAKEA